MLNLLYGPTLTSVHATGKTIALTIQTFSDGWQSDVSAFIFLFYFFLNKSFSIIKTFFLFKSSGVEFSVHMYFMSELLRIEISPQNNLEATL